MANEKITIHLTVPRSLNRKIEALARKGRRSKTAQATLLLEYAMDDRMGRDRGKEACCDESRF